MWKDEAKKYVATKELFDKTLEERYNALKKSGKYDVKNLKKIMDSIEKELGHNSSLVSAIEFPSFGQKELDNFNNLTDLTECIKCPMNEVCGKSNEDFTPFDESYYKMFPHHFQQIVDLDLPDYYQLKTTAVPVPELKEKFLQVLANSYSKKEDAVILPLSAVKINSKSRNKRRLFHEDTKLGLLLNGKDAVLWDMISEKNWHYSIAEKNLDFVFSPNFSTYFNQPACATMQNRLLDYKSIYQLSKVGVPVIPSVNFVWEEEFKSYAKWLKKSGFRYGYFNFQLCKSEAQFNKYLKKFELLNKYLPFMEIIILGVYDSDRILKLEKIRKWKYAQSYLGIIGARRFIVNEQLEKTNIDYVSGLDFSNVLATSLTNYRNYFKGKI